MIKETPLTNTARTQVYDSARQGFAPLVEFKEIWRYRDLIFFLVRRDVTARYKRSVLGVAWTMLNPLGMMIILSVVFSQVFRMEMEGYPAYVLSALITWTFFSQASSSAINALVWGGDLLQRIYIPRSAFAVSAIGTGLVNLLFSLVPLLAVTIAIGIPLHPTLLLVPAAIIPIVMFSLGVGLLISTIGIYFVDVVEMYQVLLAAWFYLTPIIYPLEILPESVQGWLWLNPMVHLVELFRNLVFYGVLPPLQEWLVSFAIAGGTLLIGWLIFTGKSDEFAYRT